MITEAKKELALKLFDIGAFLDKSKSPDGKGFKLKLHEKNSNAPLSPYYLNFRTPDNPKPGPLTPEILRDIGYILYKEARDYGFGYDCVAGVPRAGDPFAEAFAERYQERRNRELPIIKLGKKELKEKRQVTTIINGIKNQNRVTLIIDDLITKSHSKLETIKTIESAGLVVNDVLVLVDREEGGKAELAKRGYLLHFIFKFSWLLEFYLQERRITQEIYDEIKEYLAIN